VKFVDLLRYKPESRGFVCLPVSYWDFSATKSFRPHYVLWGRLIL